MFHFSIFGMPFFTISGWHLCALLFQNFHFSFLEVFIHLSVLLGHTEIDRRE
uniref:Uncharacterized protein n=1 Tax=Rhizophora mucronata TaxID=61149 RepID=A0A2P2IUY9_RHIMU